MTLQFTDEQTGKQQATAEESDSEHTAPCD